MVPHLADAGSTPELIGLDLPELRWSDRGWRAAWRLAFRGKRQPRPAGADHEDRFPDALRCRRRRWEPGRSVYGGADLTDAEVRHVLGLRSDERVAYPGEQVLPTRGPVRVRAQRHLPEEREQRVGDAPEHQDG